MSGDDEVLEELNTSGVKELISSVRLLASLDPLFGFWKKNKIIFEIGLEKSVINKPILATLPVI